MAMWQRLRVLAWAGYDLSGAYQRSHTRQETAESPCSWQCFQVACSGTAYVCTLKLCPCYITAASWQRCPVLVLQARCSQQSREHPSCALDTTRAHGLWTLTASLHQAGLARAGLELRLQRQWGKTAGCCVTQTEMNTHLGSGWGDFRVLGLV